MDYDYLIVGSGFGGSVAALRLSEKGYKVVVVEKGRWFKAEDFPKTNWNLKRWLWLPSLRWFGLFKITLFRHVNVVSGVGVGGGSLVYANTLPRPKSTFFHSGSWAGLADWEKELEPFYQTAWQMLGAETYNFQDEGDQAIRLLANELDRTHHVEPAKVAIYFGEPDVTVADPYFNGAGPSRTGCNRCGACMTGCRYNAKNTLDKNYLHLAEKHGAVILAGQQVTDIHPLGIKDGSDGYVVTLKTSQTWIKKPQKITAKGIVLAGGVLGTVPLLLKLKKKALPFLSSKVGHDIRTNNESLLGVTTFQKTKDFAEGIAIGSVLHLDNDSHLEPVSYGRGSGFWRLLMMPLSIKAGFLQRAAEVILDLLKHPRSNQKAFFVRDWAKSTLILLFMQHLDSTLQFTQNVWGLHSRVSQGKKPTSFIPQAEQGARAISHIIRGKPYALATETLLGIPTTAHILGGAVIGADPSTGVIDQNQQVFGYQNMYVCDGSAISANPGVNPSVTITALAERAMSKIPRKLRS